MSDPLIGEVRAFAFGFVPQGWAACDGQLLPIAENEALFSILGTTYGGDGSSTFGLPDLRGRAPVHPSDEISLGDAVGVETVALAALEIPAHSHEMRLGTTAPANQQTGAGNVLAVADEALYAGPGVAADTSLDGGSVTADGAEPHDNMQPSLVVTFAIALTGVFPARQ